MNKVVNINDTPEVRQAKRKMNALVDRVASICIASINAFTPEVPDEISERLKGQALLEAVIAKLEESV